MNRLTIAAALFAVLMASDTAKADPGPAPLGTAVGEYDYLTGQIVVSVDNVVNWFVERIGSPAMIGGAPLGLPTADNWVSNNDFRIGESNPGLTNDALFSVTDLNLGNVAQAGLPNDGSLNIFWNAGLGQPLQMQPLDFGGSYIPPPPPLPPPLPPPPSPPDEVFAEYNVATGQIVVSVEGVNNWYIESASASLTTDDPVGLPGAGGILTDNDLRIGESNLDLFSYSDLNLGDVAQLGLPEDDLTIFWNEGLGTPLEMWPVDYVGEFEATTVTEEPTGLPEDNGVISVITPRFDVSNFALFNVQFSETDLDIGKVVQIGMPTDGSLQTFWISGSGQQTEIRQLTEFRQLTYVGGLVSASMPIPEPTALTLFALGMIGVCSCRRRPVESE